MLIADAFDRLEATAFISGHNGVNSPYGLITRLSGAGPVVNGTSGSAGAADLVLADCYAMDNALASRWRRNAKWLAAKPVWNELREQTSVLPNAEAVWDGNLLLDYPRHLADDLDSAIVKGSNDYIMILGDFSQGYKVVDRIGTTVLFNSMLMGANRLPTGQAGWAAYKRTGADVITSNAFKVLHI